jgi:hypothetical protein
MGIAAGISFLCGVELEIPLGIILAPLGVNVTKDPWVDEG